MGDSTIIKSKDTLNSIIKVIKERGKKLGAFMPIESENDSTISLYNSSGNFRDNIQALTQTSSLTFQEVRSDLESASYATLINQIDSVYKTVNPEVSFLSFMHSPGYFDRSKKDMIDTILSHPRVREIQYYKGGRFVWGYEPQKEMRKESYNSYMRSEQSIIYPLYLLEDRIEMTGEHIEKADVKKEYQPTLSIVLTDKGAAIFSQLTKRLVGKQLAIVLNDVVYSAPNIAEQIKGKELSLSGSFTDDDIKVMRVVLNLGHFPYNLRIISEDYSDTAPPLSFFELMFNKKCELLKAGRL